MPRPEPLELFLLVAIAHTWSRGTIFRAVRENGPRDWRMLADCPLCSGFWIGIIGHLAFVRWPAELTLLGTGAAVGTLSLAVYCAIRRL